MDPRQARIDQITDRLKGLAARNAFNDDDRREVKALESERNRLERELKAGTTRKTAPEGATVARTDADGRVTAFYEDAGEQVNLRFGEARDALRRRAYYETKRDCKRALKAAGYQPYSEFKSLPDLIRAGFEGGSKFEHRVHKHYGAVLGMGEGTGADGGYMVMPEFSPGIIDRVYANPLWGMTDNYQVTGNNLTFMANAETSRATGSRHGGMRGYYVAEGATITASKPALREITAKLIKIGVVTYFTEELLNDGGSALTAYVAKKAGEEFDFMLGDGLINGTGAGQLIGILNAPSLVSVAKESGQLAATLETENIVKMDARFYAPNNANAVWLHNQDIGPELDTMTIGVGTGGVLTYMGPGGVTTAPAANLRGRPMLATEFNSTLGTQGDIIKADLGQILTISKGGVTQAVALELQFLTDQLAVRWILRVGNVFWESAPITPYKGGSNTQSNFITLDTRA